jgi:hypothetical protein
VGAAVVGLGVGLGVGAAVVGGRVCSAGRPLVCVVVGADVHQA